MNNLAKNLTSLRKINNFTQDDIAAKVYVSRQAVSKWERGESLPDLETLTALSELYDISIDDMIKSDLSAYSSSNAKVDKIFNKLKLLRRKQNVKLMSVWALLLLGGYALIAGIIQIAVYDIAPNIWIFWFTLPVVPPIIFAIKFRHEIGKKWIMFFVNVPFIAAIVYLLIIYECSYYGAWVAFLIIPVYYLAAVLQCIHQFKKERAAKQQ